jgi:hypothetical protein
MLEAGVFIQSQRVKDLQQRTLCNSVPCDGSGSGAEQQGVLAVNEHHSRPARVLRRLSTVLLVYISILNVCCCPDLCPCSVVFAPGGSLAT